MKTLMKMVDKGFPFAYNEKEYERNKEGCYVLYEFA